MYVIARNGKTSPAAATAWAATKDGPTLLQLTKGTYVFFDVVTGHVKPASNVEVARWLVESGYAQESNSTAKALEQAIRVNSK